MGAFSLFRRLRTSESAKTTASDAGAATSTGKSTTATSKTGDDIGLRRLPSKSKKAANKAAGNAAPPASSDAVVAIPAVAPRVDLSILRSPSPPLVEIPLEGYRANSPWVDLAADVEPPRRGSFGFGYTRTSSSSPTTRAVNEKLAAYLDGKLITPEQATVLVQECAKVLQGQGLETLGIFRPWRLAESPYIISRTLALFLRAVCPEDAIPLDDRDLLGFSTNEDPLDAAREALADAGTHNVVACLKWGLRHLQYGPDGFDGQSSRDMSKFYTTLIESEAKASYDCQTYQHVVLDLLPKEHGTLLTVCLELFAAIAAHDAQNAMPGLHLCRLLAFWLFGRQHHNRWDDWLDLYRDYLMAAGCLEHLFLSYLRYQDKIALRLKALITPYPPEQRRLKITDIPHSMQHSQPLNVIHIVIQAGHKSPSESLGNSRSTRLPGVLFASAIEASGDQEKDDELKTYWAQLVNAARAGDSDGVDLQAVVVDETERIFAVIAEKADRKHVRITSDKRASFYGNRRRSASIDVGMMQSTSSKSSDSIGRNRALSNDVRMQSSPSQAGDFCWGDFASKGFSDEFDSDTFSLFSDVGRPSMDEEASIARGPQKLKKPYPYASLASRHMQFERCYYAERDEQSNAPVVATIKEMKMVQVDPIFLEVYLDSLESPTVTSKWPVFAVAELKSTYLPCNAVVVEVENAKPTMEPQLPLFSTVAIPSSPSENDKSVAKQKRGLFSLGSRKKRPPIQETDKEPPESSDRAEKARFDEFGKRISVKSAAPSRPTQGHSQTSRSPRPFSTASTSREKRRTSTTTDSGPDSIQISEFKAPIRSSPKPDTIAEVEETPEDRSTPSPSGSKSSTGRKLSRKPVPLMADEEAALSAEVTEAADTARECNIAEVPDIIVAVPQADSSLDAVPIPPPSDYSSPVLSRHTASDDEVVAQVKDSQNNQQSTGDPHSITGNASVPVVIISHEEDDEPSSRLQEAESNALEGHTQDAHPAEPVPNVDDSAVAADTKPGDNDQEIIASEPFVDGQKITSESIDEENRMESLPASAAPARQNADEAEIQDSVVSETEPEEVEAKPAEDIAEPVPSVDADTIDDIKRGDTDMNASGIEQSASTPKRFGSTLNRVSPSLKERFGSSNKTQTTPEQAGMDSSGLKAQPPPSPSRRAALLSGAKKMLTRRKSAPLHSDSVVTNKEVEHPPLPRVVDIPILATDALAETQTAAQDPNNASEASIASSSSTIEPEEGGLTSAAPQSNTVKHGDVLLPSVGPAESEETPDGFPSATETDSHHQDGGSDGLKHATTDTKHVEVADLTSLQSDDATSIEHAIVDSQSLDENRGHSSTEPTAERLESDSSENPVPEVRADLAETEDIRHTPEDTEIAEISGDRSDSSGKEDNIGDNDKSNDDDELAVPDINDAALPETSSSLLSPFTTLLSAAENTLATSAESLGTVVSSMLPTSLISSTQSHMGADERAAGVSESTGIDHEPHADSDSENTDTSQEQELNEGEQPHVEPSGLDKTPNNAPLRQKEDITQPSGEVFAGTTHVDVDEIVGVDRETVEEGPAPVEQSEVAGQDDASTRINEPQDDKLQQEALASTAQDPTEVKVTAGQAADDISSDLDLCHAVAAAAEVTPHARDNLAPSSSDSSSLNTAQRNEGFEDIESTDKKDVEMDTGNVGSEHTSVPIPVHGASHTEQSIFGHLATPEQVESSASIITSPISGLPIHVSQQRDENMVGGHDAFHKDGTQEHLHEVQPDTSENSSLPHAEPNLVDDDEDSRDMTVVEPSSAEQEHPLHMHEGLVHAPDASKVGLPRAASDEGQAMRLTSDAASELPVEDAVPASQAALNMSDNSVEEAAETDLETSSPNLRKIVDNAKTVDGGMDPVGTAQGRNAQEAPQGDPSLVAEVLLAEVEARKEKPLGRPS